MTEENGKVDSAVIKTEKQSASTDKPWEWKKGQSGNPLGRPRKSDRLADQIEALGIEAIVFKGKRSERFHHLAKIIWDNALKQKPFFIKTLMEIQAGQMKRLEISTNAEGEVIIGWRSRGTDDEKGPL